MTHIQEAGPGIFTIDTGFDRAGLVASHLMLHQGRAAFFDVGVTNTLPALREAMVQLGVTDDMVDWVFVTHVHLDHAGAAGVLMRHLPQARLAVHPRGARHMIDPAKLVAGATAVYGSELMQQRFGEVAPIPADRVEQVEDGRTVSLGGRRLRIADTPGHARHHYCVFDELSEGWFSGDTFGLSYREFDTEAGAMMFPTTTPVQFDPPTLHASVDRLMAASPKRMYLTHFGAIDVGDFQARQLHEGIDKLVDVALAARTSGEARMQTLSQGIGQVFLQMMREHGCVLSEARALDLMAMDIELNAQGLACWLDQQAA